MALGYVSQSNMLPTTSLSIILGTTMDFIYSSPTNWNKKELRRAMLATRLERRMRAFRQAMKAEVEQGLLVVA